MAIYPVVERVIEIVVVPLVADQVEVVEAVVLGILEVDLQEAPVALLVVQMVEPGGLVLQVAPHHLQLLQILLLLRKHLLRAIRHKVLSLLALQHLTVHQVAVVAVCPQVFPFLQGVLNQFPSITHLVPSHFPSATHR